MNSDPNPYSAPSGDIREVAGEAAPALWNPNAATAWSLLFSPVFGAYLQMRNWQALGDAPKAQASWYWCISTFALIVLLVFASVLLPDGNPMHKLADRSGLIILLVWYFANGKQQIAYVKERFGTDYPRKGWGAPLGIAFGALFVFFMALVVVGFVLAATGHAN